jgi:hypothetical protein
MPSCVAGSKYFNTGRPLACGDDGKRFIVHADEKLTAFVELEAACACGELA